MLCQDFVARWHRHWCKVPRSPESWGAAHYATHVLAPLPIVLNPLLPLRFFCIMPTTCVRWGSTIELCLCTSTLYVALSGSFAITSWI